MGCTNSKKEYQASNKGDTAKQVFPAPPPAPEPAYIGDNTPTPNTDLVKPVTTSAPTHASAPAPAPTPA